MVIIAMMLGISEAGAMGGVSSSILFEGRLSSKHGKRLGKHLCFSAFFTIIHEIMLYEFEGFRPVVHERAFVHPLAVVIGRVALGCEVYVGPGAVLRGDWGRIEIADGCNVQENCVLHMFPGLAVVLEEGAHIGHGAVVHGAVIGRNSLIGMNAVIMDEAEIGPECIVGALSFVKAGEKIPARSLVAGNPARVLREVSDEMLAWKTEGTRLYRQLPEACRQHLRPCEPLREKPANWADQEATYRPWKSRPQ